MQRKLLEKQLRELKGKGSFILIDTSTWAVVGRVEKLDKNFVVLNRYDKEGLFIEDILIPLDKIVGLSYNSKILNEIRLKVALNLDSNGDQLSIDSSIPKTQNLFNHLFKWFNKFTNPETQETI